MPFHQPQGKNPRGPLTKTSDKVLEISHPKTEGEKNRPWWDYLKFQHDKVKVLLVGMRHLLLSEIGSALERLGHPCKVLLIGGEELDCESIEKMFIDLIKTFQPDFVLTVNHSGFDQEGFVTGLLSHYRVPFASWYVDSPYLIIRHYAQNKSPYLTLFLWDEDYIEIVKKLGFDRVEYLPLGVDEMLFKPMDFRKNPFSPLATQVSFVGNSMVIKVRSILNRCGIRGLLLERFEEVSAEFAKSHHLIVREMLGERFPELVGELAKLAEPQALGFEWAVTWHATGLYRAALIKELHSFEPLISGDPGWREIIGENFRLHKELNYYSELPAFYNVSKVSFNATSRQMKEGVNQRIFDVTASRGVVITDWTRQLEHLMEPGREVLVYRNKNEIPEQVSRALRDEAFRRAVSEAGYRRVLHEHTYCHRLQYLIKVIKRNYG